MFRFISRHAAIAVIALLLALACLPTAAQARDLRPASQGMHLDLPSLDSALSWLSRLLGDAPEQPARQAKTKPTLGKATANTGSCIDPQGHPRPCA